MSTRPARWTIAARLFALQVAFVVVLAGVAAAWAWRSSAADVDREAGARCTALAIAIADNPFVVDAVASEDPSALLQPYALDLMRDTATDFVTIMAPDRTRYTHPDPAEIGRPFRGTIAPALEGRSFTETYTGTLGPSVRAVVPIEDADGDVVAVVAAGVTVANIQGTLVQRLWLIIAASMLAILIGAVLAGLLSRYLGRVTGGRGPEELGRMLGYYEGVLHSVREGLVLVDAQGRLTMCNDQARELLSLPADGELPAAVADLDLPDSVQELLASGRVAADEVHVTDDRLLVLNQQVTSAKRAGRTGTVTTLRDHTELLHLTDEVKTMRTLSDALRSQTHEFANRLHTVVALIELGRAEDAARFAARELELGQAMADQLVEAVDEPVLAALLLGKAAQARERSVALELDVEPGAGGIAIDAGDLVTIVGNLIDNALDATTGAVVGGPDVGDRGVGGPDVGDRGVGGLGVTRRPTVRVGIRRLGTDVLLLVHDNGPGLADPGRAFERGYSTKAAGPDGRGFGLALVRQAVVRAGGRLEVESGPEGTRFTVRLRADENVVDSVLPLDRAQRVTVPDRPDAGTR